MKVDITTRNPFSLQTDHVIEINVDVLHKKSGISFSNVKFIPVDII